MDSWKSDKASSGILGVLKLFNLVSPVGHGLKNCNDPILKIQMHKQVFQ